jgi:hypothetical protein
MNPTMIVQPQLTFRLYGVESAALQRGEVILAWLEQLAELLARSAGQPMILTSRPTQTRFSPRAWARASKAMLAQEIESVSVGVDLDHGWHAAGHWWWSYPRSGVSQVFLHDTRARGAIIPPNRFVRVAQDVAAATGLAQGFLWPHPPLSDYFALSRDLRDAGAGLEYGPNALARYARRLGWALWLTDGHLAGLGGRARVRHEAPVHRVAEHEAGLWLELTANPLDVPAEALDRLRQFLAPITPTPEIGRASCRERV